jgi:hypothetical protein
MIPAHFARSIGGDFLERLAALSAAGVRFGGPELESG